ncbi:MAG: hypothetical protein ACYTFN_20150 [Planctomycetota bacterium]|jgi:hypothetical protein
MSRNSRPRLSLPWSILAGVVLMLAMPLAAQTASYTYINQKAPYLNPDPAMLTAVNLPKVGTTFEVMVPESWFGIWAGCGASYYLAFGVRNPNVLIPGMGGFLFTSADIVVPVPFSTTPQLWGGGTVVMSFQIPNSPKLVGVRFHQQVLAAYDAEWAPRTYHLSRGGVGVIGK